MEIVQFQDLGWVNAGGDTAHRIEEAVSACQSLGHKRTTTNEGTFGTRHRISCGECGYSYHEDSGD